MSLIGPNEEDTRKLNLEVNQIVNQRLTLTTLGLTLFGVIIAWLIPKEQYLVGAVSAFVYAAISLLLVTLFVLFLLTYHLSSMLRLFTSYLRATEASGWEQDWKQYRRRFSYFGYTKPQALLFLLLGFVSAAFPILLAHLYNLNSRLWGVVSCLVTGAAYITFVYGMGMRGWFGDEDTMYKHWMELKDEQDKRDCV